VHTAELDPTVYAGISELIERIAPGARVLDIAPLGSDSSAGGGTVKAKGYGVALLVTVTNPEAGGATSKLVFHTADSDEFGHDRRADRAASAILAYDTYPLIPDHVRALDVGTVGADGHLASLRGAGEFYLVTRYAEGQIYAEDLRSIARRGHATTLDDDRCDALAHHLAALHAERISHPFAYRRSIRDLVGHGEGIYGIIDSYPSDVPAAPPARLQAIERRCADFRWRLRGREHRLSRTHGDFHPFNIVFDAQKLTLLDTSRGSAGDPADDVACMAINYVFFALQTPGAWSRGFGVLWRRFWDHYLERTGDMEVLEVASPFLAWRGLVLANPRWYPMVAADTREALLGFVERALDAERFDPASAEGLFSS
jgi:aminoglycoside phosphotransferase (APT) family kinase protein